MSSVSLSNRTLELPDAAVAYDVREPAAPSTHPPVLMIGQPMTAQGFDALAAEITDRAVVTYDPRGLGRSTRTDGSAANYPKLQAEDLHALIAELGRGPVDVFGSSGGAVAGLALVTAHPEDVRVLVAHEPPIFSLLADAEQAAAAEHAVNDAYRERGFGAGMAAFIAMASWQGEFNEESLRRGRPLIRRASVCPATTTAREAIPCCPAPRAPSLPTSQTSQRCGHRRPASSWRWARTRAMSCPRAAPGRSQTGSAPGSRPSPAVMAGSWQTRGARQATRPGLQHSFETRSTNRRRLSGYYIEPKAWASRGSELSR